MNDIPIPDGTKMLFVQSAAPTGWSRINTHNDKALRIVNGNDTNEGQGEAGGDSGPQGVNSSVEFTTAFSSQAVTGSNSATTAGGSNAAVTLTANQSGMPSHRHTVSMETKHGDVGTARGPAPINNVGKDANAGYAAYQLSSYESANANASHNHAFTGTSHNHTFTGTSINLQVKYVNAIVCQKDTV